MKTLHSINKFELTDEELAILYYVQMGHESNWSWHFCIGPNGKLWCKKGYMGKLDSYQPVENLWNPPLRLWEDHGKPFPDLSILKSYEE